MASHSELRAGLTKALFFSLLSFFLVPGITYGFVTYVFHHMDSDYRAAVQSRIATAPGTAAQKDAIRAAAEAFVPSRRCDLKPAGPAIASRGAEILRAL